MKLLFFEFWDEKIRKPSLRLIGKYVKRIEYESSVLVESTYEIKKIDFDYFLEE